MKRVKRSRWAASAPSVSANELPEFTAQTHLHVHRPARQGLDTRVKNYQQKNKVLIEEQMDQPESIIG